MATTTKEKKPTRSEAITVDGVVFNTLLVANERGWFEIKSCKLQDESKNTFGGEGYWRVEELAKAGHSNFRYEEVPGDGWHCYYVPSGTDTQDEMESVDIAPVLTIEGVHSIEIESIDGKPPIKARIDMSKPMLCPCVKKLPFFDAKRAKEFTDHAFVINGDAMRCPKCGRGGKILD